MTANRTGARVLTALAIALIVVACDVESSRPTPTAPGLPTGPPAPVITRIQLTGPTTVNLGETVQYTATGFLSDGGSRDITAEAQWRSFQPTVLTAGTGGRFTGAKSGDTGVSAAVSRVSASIGSVIVVPEGTYRVKGTVRDAGVAVDARVKIEDQAAGAVVVDAIRGSYVMYGAAGTTFFTVTKNGYEETKKTEVITSHRVIDFDLNLSGARADVSGTYMLTISADPSCTGLADDLRSRTYTATIQQNGPQLTVTLGGADFYLDHGRTLNSFKGFLEADRAVFNLFYASYYFYYYGYTPEVLEFLATNRYYAFEGAIVTSVSRNVLSGTLSGTITPFTVSPLRPGAASTRCLSSNHRVVFTR